MIKRNEYKFVKPHSNTVIIKKSKKVIDKNMKINIIKIILNKHIQININIEREK